MLLGNGWKYAAHARQQQKCWHCDPTPNVCWLSSIHCPRDRSKSWPRCARARVSDAFDTAVRVARACEAANIPYAIGGAFAYGQHAVPRATNDVDVNVFLEPDALGDFFSAMEDAGIAVDRLRAIADAKADGLLILYDGLFRIDVFTPSIAFSWSAQATRVRRSLGDIDAWFLSAEALAVFKLLFFRTKDLADLERLVAFMGKGLDVKSIRAHIVEMLGADDERVSAWDRICVTFMPD